MQIEGKLQYMGWSNLPWKLVMDNGETDLWPVVEKFFVSLNGKRAKQDRKRDSYVLVANESSDLQFNYVPDEYALLEKVGEFGAVNIRAHLDNALVWLSGRIVKIEIDDEQIKFTADKEDFGVYFVDGGNSCDVPMGAEQNICKIGQHDCCIFLSVGADGFYCEKFSGLTARLLLDRFAKGTVQGRIGECALLERKKRKCDTMT